MNFGLATLIGQQALAALEINSRFWPLDRLRNAGLDVPALEVKEIFEDWFRNLPRLELLAQRCADDNSLSSLSIGAGEARLGIALQYPNKVIAVGANYAGHLVEMGLPAARWDPLPFFFKPPTTTMVGPGMTIVQPKTTRQLDWEIELAVVIGRRLTDATREEAWAAIAGYSIGLDLSARDLIPQPHSAVKIDLMRGKCQDTMCPFGPVIRPAQFVTDPHNLRLKLSVNGVIRQDASTSEMLYRIDEQLSIISQFVTLEPGDVILTGAPAGSGAAHGVFLKPGDLIEASIEQIGTLEVGVIGKSVQSIHPESALTH
jgi:2-keto-4-pentenoate hydratase/2-oxohepta-3-ene-1,7-dioic acid hydratase in catechol pathway